MRLIQTHSFTTKEFELLENKMRCKHKDSITEEEYEIPYESFHIHQISKRTTLPKYVMPVVGILLIIALKIMIGDSGLASEHFLILFFLGIAGWRVILWLKKKELLIPTSQGQIIVWEELPSKQEVETFLNKLNETIKEYLLKKYGTVDHDLPIETQLTNFVYLRDTGIISEDLFQELKTKALNKGNNRPIGF